MQGSANLNIMMKAARAAGKSLVKDFREVENLQVSTKSAGDFVSRADIAAEAIARDQWEIEVAGQRHTADASLRPLYDPEMKKIKC